MKAVFVEMRVFENYRRQYISDSSYAELQLELMVNPRRGAVIVGTGGLRKLRLSDHRRGKGKRGGIRVIYYYYELGDQFWMFMIYSKGEMTDLSKEEKGVFRQALIQERKLRV